MNQIGHMRDDGARGGHGYFRSSRGHGTRLHDGIDIRGDLNVTPAVAFLGGTVSEIRNQPRGYGNIVIVNHGNGLTSRYAHLQNGSISAAGIAVGTQVAQGQAVGTVGNTGNARNTTPHLHFEIRRNNVPTNPETFLNQPCPP